MLVFDSPARSAGDSRTGHVLLHDLRGTIADAAGLPPLDLFEGYFRSDLFRSQADINAVVAEAVAKGHDASTLPLAWDALPTDPLQILLRMPDDGGRIPHAWWRPLGTRLEELAQGVSARSQELSDQELRRQNALRTFALVRLADGLGRANALGEDARFV